MSLDCVVYLEVFGIMETLETMADLLDFAMKVDDAKVASDAVWCLQSYSARCLSPLWRQRWSYWTMSLPASMSDSERLSFMQDWYREHIFDHAVRNGKKGIPSVDKRGKGKGPSSLFPP